MRHPGLSFAPKGVICCADRTPGVIDTAQMATLSSAKPLKRGSLTAFVRSHRLAWELAMAALTLVYVALSLIVDEGAGAAVNAAVAILAVLFLAEFSLRCWDSKSRVGYLREHW